VLEYQKEPLLAYSADTTFDTEHIEFLAAAPLIIHETGAGVHTAYERLAALPEQIRTRMRLIHYSDNFSPQHSLIPCLQEGERLTIDLAEKHIT
jgi:ribonuclease BN (tRNA processing enzyme)